MKHENEEQTPPGVTVNLLKVSTIIGMIGTVSAAILASISLLDERPEKGVVIFSILTLLVLLYTILSRRAHRTAASRKRPAMRNLVIVTVLNLLVLGLPIGVLGIISTYYGFMGLGESLSFGISFIFLAMCAALFFISHVMTLTVALMTRRTRFAPK